MANPLKKAWREVLRPMYQRPRSLQVAALCYRGKGKSREVLLITSRGTGRWILPKGWLIDGLNGAASAAREAWEEAGVKPAKIREDAIGSFDYDKRLDSGLPLPIETQVYAVKVDKLAKSYPEVGQRRRKWVSPSEAARLVQEPKLKALLKAV